MLGTPKIHLTCFIAIFALLWWPGTETPVSLRSACSSHIESAKNSAGPSEHSHLCLAGCALGCGCPGVSLAPQCHRCTVGPQDGLMEGSRVRLLFVASGDCCVCSLLETQPISAHPPAGSLFPCSWPGSDSSPGTLGCPLGSTFPKTVDLTYRTPGRFLSGFSLFAVPTVGRFLLTVCRPLGYPLLPPSPPPLSLPSLLGVL